MKINKGCPVLIYELISDGFFEGGRSNRKYMINMIYKKNDIQRFECF